MYRIVSLLVLVLLNGILLAPVLAVEKEKTLPTSALVLTQVGTLPIILSAPHGGLKKVPGVSPRKGEGLPKGASGFFTGRDGNTDLLTFELAKAIEAKMGKKPYFVVARFHRKYIDANRPAKIGYESPKAKATYDVYHKTLEHYCREVQRTFGRGLLLDIHGQGTAKDTIFRGTKNGTTVKLLIQRYGMAAHNGPKSFFGLLAKEGCKVHPTDGSKERSGFTGGYIVQTYGSHQGYGIDAIQLEHGGDYRTKANVKDSAKKIAAAIEAYAKLYLPAKKKE